MLCLLPAAALAERKPDVVSPTMLIKQVTAEVMRGQDVDIPLRVVPAYGGEVRVEISQPCSFGSLEPVGRLSASTPVFRYSNKPEFKTSEDSFRFRVKSPGHAWNTYTATILIRDPQGSLSVRPEKINFGKVALGCVGKSQLCLSNRFGTDVSGTLLAPAPYRVSGDGHFSLAEGETVMFEICFSPTGIYPDEATLKVVPELTGFPVISLSGEGVVPFVINTNAATLSSESPRASFQITNQAAVPLMLEWSGDPALDYSPSTSIPPHGVARVAVSMGRLVPPVGGGRTIHSILGTRSYSIPVEITALGPPGSVAIEPARGSGTTTGTTGKPLPLSGLLRNTSAFAHQAELVLVDHEGGAPISRTNVTIPPISNMPFEVLWTPSTSGHNTPSLQLLEEGKVIASASWNASVKGPATNALPPDTPASPARKSPLNTPSVVQSSPETRIASQGENDEMARKIAEWLPPRFEEGLLRRNLVLGWRYLGSGSPRFEIVERRYHNSLTDRSGDVPSEEWVKIPGRPVLNPNGGIWELKIPIPTPGMHVYAVYPDDGGEKIISQLSVGITWGMYAWPALRTLLLSIFIVSLVKVIRRRI